MKRQKQIKKNVLSGIIYRVISITLPFLLRTVLFHYLGSEYVGMGSLFASVLQVLNIAELGISSAIVFNLYAPLEQKDSAKVSALLNYYRTAYYKIGAFIFGAGLLAMPFIKWLNQSEWPSAVNIYVVFLLYLVNSSISYYLYSYYSALLNAAQRIDRVNVINMTVDIVQNIAQILAVMLFKNYYLFVGIMVMGTIAKNLCFAWIAKRDYPNYRAAGSVGEEEKKEIATQIKGLMIGRLSDISRNSFDTIAVSVLYGLSCVAIYNNYYYVFAAVYSLVLAITHALQAIIGNDIVVETKQQSYDKIKILQFMYMWITTVLVICMVCLYQPFMILWMGKALTLSDTEMILFCVYFYVLNANNARNLYFTGNGMWWTARISFMLEAGFNLTMNFILGYFFGIYGILLSTILTVVVFNYLSRTRILFRDYFEMSPKEYYLLEIRYFIVAAMITASVYLGTNYIGIEGVPGFIIKGAVAFIAGNCLLLLVYCRSKQFKICKERYFPGKK